MKLRQFGALLLTVSMALLSVCHLPANAGAKRRVAVLPFEYGAVSSEVGTYDVGKGITSLVITRLVNDGSYSVVDRQMLDSILKEQNLSVSDRADPATACKIGKILACDAIIVGTVTQFGFEKKSTNLSGVASLASYAPYGSFASALGGFGSKKAKCHVAIDARIIDVNTTEILGAVNGIGESKRGGVSLFGGAAGSGGSFDFGSDGFATSIAGEATLAAVDQVTGQLNGMASKIPDNQSLAAQNVQGKIADVTGNQVILNVGKINGLGAGDTLQVERPYKTIKDPTSGKVIKELNATVGVIRLTQVESDNATGEIVRGNALQVGDNVRKVQTDVSAIVLTPLNDTSSGAAAGLKKTTKQ